MKGRRGVDISNYTTLTQQKAEYLRHTCDFVIIGLQSASKARAFKNQLLSPDLELQYYVDLPGRDLSIADVGSMCWIDIEPGCFQDAQAVRDQGTANTARGLRTGIYCNKTSLQPVFGDSHELADFGCPLLYAAYQPPDFAAFVPFNGWSMPEIWQYSSKGLVFNYGATGTQSINADLCIERPMS